MIRLACGLAILALLALLGMVLQTSGGTATLYAFIGIPSLALAILVYLAAEGGHVRRQVVRWLGGSVLLLGALLTAPPDRPDADAIATANLIHVIREQPKHNRAAASVAAIAVRHLATPDDRSASGGTAS